MTADAEVSRVEVVYFMGRTSGFQQSDCPLARVNLVTKGVTKAVGQGMNEYAWTRHYAHNIAKEWSLFLDWPIVVLEEQVKVTKSVTYKEVQP